ncbi:hypothetical protein SPI_03673 [Niveomyces insectorum RCEF 264]|uniref:Uncharacterized protein n=1 Tax=Niveomyces insectorum RCEF 264 TaxID=1081102 RepID=A0A162ML15_9HYPO|nr:hypothetical protein SPI_03673 [Niveomyces insectorum RCEF 264]
MDGPASDQTALRGHTAATLQDPHRGCAAAAAAAGHQHACGRTNGGRQGQNRPSHHHHQHHQHQHQHHDRRQGSSSSSRRPEGRTLRTTYVTMWRCCACGGDNYLSDSYCVDPYDRNCEHRKCTDYCTEFKMKTKAE